MRALCTIFLFFVFLGVRGQVIENTYLNNPSVGISTFDVRIREKVTSANVAIPHLATSFMYVYLSDVLRDDCINEEGVLDKRKFYDNIKRYFDHRFNYSNPVRYNIRIFPEYNGAQPCRNAKTISSQVTDDGKLTINYPEKLHKVLVKRKFPPFIIKAIFPTNFKETKNIALMDLRNPLVQHIYAAALELFARYLEEKVPAPIIKSSTNADTICRKGDFISRIEMGYVGPWGEGMTKYYCNHIDAASLKKIAEMYKRYLWRYTLVAPSFGMRTNTTKNKELYSFEYYLLTTKYGTFKEKKGELTGRKEFGLFIDHIGSSDSNYDFSLSYKGIDFKTIALQKYKVAPVIGENSGRFAKEDSLVIKDIMKYGISLCNAWTSVDITTVEDEQVMKWKEASNYFGYRFYMSTLRTKISDYSIHVYFHLGNRSYSPLYDDFWLPQFVIRDSNDCILQVIDADKFINLKSIPCLKDSFKYEVMVNKTIPLNRTLPKGAKVYFRVIDKCHICENMFFDNEGRTEHGEYLLSINN